MIDVEKMRDRVETCAIVGDETPLMMAARVELLRMNLGKALDELEALRKPVAPCRFDVAAARAELVEIDAAWFDAASPNSEEYAFQAARALLDKALAAIEAGWPEVDIEGAGKVLWDTLSDGRSWTVLSTTAQRIHVKGARAVLAHVGRAPSLTTDVPQGSPTGPSPAAGVTITDAMVEEAAIRAWCAPDADGITDARKNWPLDYETRRQKYRNEARAVLEYAASLAPTVPAVDPRAERIMRYRCVAPHVILATAWAPVGGRTDEAIIERIETIAHAMLAAERGPDAV